jgi:hypothetical protein
MIIVVGVIFVAQVSIFGEFLSSYLIAWLVPGPHTYQSGVCFDVGCVFLLVT